MVGKGGRGERGTRDARILGSVLTKKKKSPIVGVGENEEVKDFCQQRTQEKRKKGATPVNLGFNQS